MILLTSILTTFCEDNYLETGKLVISLDFEMMWGAIFNKAVEKGYIYRVPYVEKIIPGILELFKKYNIHATWAIVGAIACGDEEEACFLADKEIIDPYGNQTLQKFILDIKSEDFNLYFRPDLVKMVAESKNQEIATHTFSHFYFFEHRFPKKKLESEINASLKTLAPYSKNPIKTIVLPKNQVSPEVYSLLRKNGITNVRGIQISTRFNKSNFFSKVMRFADAYIPICGRSSYKINSVYENQIFNVRASRFWRAYYKKLAFLEPLKIKRIKKEMLYSAKNNEIYHLWFHPHNLSSDYKKNLKNLEKIFAYYNYLNKKYGMQSLNISECVLEVERINNGKRSLHI